MDDWNDPDANQGRGWRRARNDEPSDGLPAFVDRHFFLIFFLLVAAIGYASMKLPEYTPATPASVMSGQ